MEEWNAGLRLRFQPVGLTGRRVEPTPRREYWDKGGNKASEKINHPILLVFRPIQWARK